MCKPDFFGVVIPTHLTSTLFCSIMHENAVAYYSNNTQTNVIVAYQVSMISSGAAKCHDHRVLTFHKRNRLQHLSEVKGIDILFI